MADKAKTHLKEGDKAPDFKGFDQDGNLHQLSDYSKDKLILFFYPKDNTPGCTAEACNLRDNFSELKEKGFKLLGISADSAKRHQNFISKFDLPFPLLADEDLSIIKAYGVWGRKKFMGREFDGILRTTFVIEKGKITSVIEKSKPRIMQLRFWNKLLFFSFFLFVQYGCSVKPLYVLRDAASDYIPPDYSNPDNWAALPIKSDSADALPDTIFRDIQDHAAVDVFFLHPTSYTGDRGQRYWNARLDDQEVNLKTDRTSILHQASIFNGAGKVYAPRYRQAHIYAYFTKKNKSQAREAFELAYQDVVAAFKYYLTHYNHGRPVIIACHSQGSTHGMRLLKEFFDNKDLQDQLVVAYLLGMPVNKNYFNEIPVCETPDQTGCFCSWRTYKSGYLPKRFPVGDSIAVVNPLSWTTDQDLVGKDKNKGAILRNYHQGIWTHLTDARIEQGVLWVCKPHFPFSFLLRTKNYHAGDFNLFWLNVRENVKARVHSFLMESEH